MGTVMNGDKWSGVCVNGNLVNGLVKNGVIFYKKVQQELYKRRIMVGDNIKGKNIYSIFPKNHWNNMEVSYGTYNYIISLENSDYGIYETLIFGPMDDIYRVASFGISGQYLYNYDVDSGMEDQNNSLFDSRSEYIVSSVIETNSSYRCLYVEDPNIRPIEVGDIITENTKFYFTIPDNFDEIMSTYKGSASVAMLEDNNKFIMALYLDLLGDISTEVTFSGADSFQVYYKQGTTYFKNISSAKNIGETNKFTGIVASINKSNPAYNYILIDKTTLG